MNSNHPYGAQRTRMLSLLLVGGAVVVAGGTFVYKLYEFIVAASQGQMPGLLIASVVPYFLVSLGFLLLAAWAYGTGQFRDIEGPKYQLIEDELELERLEREGRVF